MNETIILEPIIQYGFLGFSGVLLGIVVWLIRRLLTVLDQNNRVISENTAAVQNLTILTKDLMVLNRSLHDKIISRPCIVETPKVLHGCDH